MPDDKTRPEKLKGHRVDGTNLLSMLTELLKDAVLDLGGPDTGPTAPFLTLEEFMLPIYSPELIERVLLLYGLTLRAKIQ